MSEPPADSMRACVERFESYLDAVLPAASDAPHALHEAMRYAVLNGGKRVRPLLVYASGECLDVPAQKLDPPAAAIELIHSFSLVHDDLPAMDDDDLRRGLPTVHRRFDEATAILAGDALLPLAFRTVAGSASISDRQKVSLVKLIATASGSLGMTGGQAMDLASEGSRPTGEELEKMHAQKTGALIHACVMSAYCVCDNVSEERERAMDVFGRNIGLAFQIRDDLLDVEGDTATIGKLAGSDIRRDKATWPAVFGVDASRRRCRELIDAARQSLAPFGERAASLCRLADYVVERSR